MLGKYCFSLGMISVGLLVLLSSVTIKATAKNKSSNPLTAIVIHAGAGNIKAGDLTSDKEKKIREALKTGYKVLKKGGSSLNAIEATITILENSPLFNAGKGAVYTHDETHELDASIMNGKTLEAGAVAGVKTIKNPIKLARAVMESSNHVLLVGQGAETFAAEHNIVQVDNHYFDTEKNLKRLREIKQKNPDQFKLGHKTHSDSHFSTVGAVALDMAGNLAAGTSTGGMTNKRYGRVGDSPIIGAGTYADNRSCGVSATGHGEYFIRHVVAYSICNLTILKGINLAQAANQVINDTLVKAGGNGGIVAMDAKGNIVVEFNTSGMYYGYIDTQGDIKIDIFK